MYNQFLRAAVQYTGLDTAVHRVNNKICKNCQLRNNRGETTRSTFLCVSNSICSSFVSCFRGASVCVVLYYYYGEPLQVPAAAVPSNSSLTTYVTRDAADYEDSDNVAD